MKAAVIHEYGDSNVFKHEDVAMPEPGATEVLVKVHTQALTLLIAR